MKVCNACLEVCMCANCVKNMKYAVNTPKPCHGASCDICEDHDMAVWGCNQHLTIEEVNARIEASRGNK